MLPKQQAKILWVTGSVEVPKVQELRTADLTGFFFFFFSFPFFFFFFNQSYRQVRLNELLQEHSRAANLIVLWVARFWF